MQKFNFNYPTPLDVRGTEHKKPEYVKLHWPEFFEYINKKYPNDRIPVQLYMFFNDIEEHPKCACGKLLEYRSPKLGFRQFCSIKCATNSKDVQNKSKVTQEERYGGVGFASQILAAKATSSNIERYGVENAMQSDEIKQKLRETNLERYGVGNTTQIPEVMEKIKQTQTERYGGFGMASPDIMEKIKQTQTERYGGFGMAAEHMQRKSKDTVNELYGVDYNSQRPDVRTKAKYTRVRSIRKKYPIIQSVTWRNGMKIYNCSCPHPECGKCSGTFSIYNEQFYRRLQDGTELCTKLLPYQHPKQNNTTVEVYIRMLLDNMGIKYVQNDRSIIPPKEVDFYLPDYNIAIECNGIHWHSVEFKDKRYHVEKFLECQAKGIQLLSFWEDWIVSAPLIIKSILESKLHKSTNKVFARKCTIQKVDSNIANDFLFANHIQGRCVSSIRYGLYHKGELISLMTFGKKRPAQGNKSESWELIRFCNKLGYSVPGAASKLLNAFIREYKPDQIISFSSNDISNGSLYEKLGFRKGGISCAYWYVGKNYRRYHRFTFCKAKLIKMGYDKNKTEREIMRSTPYYCIYDSGQTKWVLTVK